MGCLWGRATLPPAPAPTQQKWTRTDQGLGTWVELTPRSTFRRQAVLTGLFPSSSAVSGSGSLTPLSMETSLLSLGAPNFPQPLGQTIPTLSPASEASSLALS